MISIFLFVLCTFVVFIPMIMEVLLNKFDFFNVKNLFLIYFYLELPLSGIISILSKDVDVLSLPVKENLYYYNLALLASFIGLLMFQLGYYFTTKRTLKCPLFFKSKFNTENANLLIIGLFSIGYFCFILFILLNGGVSAFMDNREEFRAGGVSGQGILLFPSTQFLIYSALIFFLLQMKKYVHAFSFNTKITVIFFFIICLIPSFLFGFRSLIGLPVLQFLVLWNFGVKKISLKKLVPIFSFIIFLFVGYGIVREIPPDLNISKNQIIEIVKEKPELAYSFLVRVKGVEVLAFVIKNLETSYGYEFGVKNLIETITIPIPHAIFKDKPTPSGVRFTTYFFGQDLAFIRGITDKDEFGGISPTILGESFWQFGWFGIILIPLFFGIIYKIVYSFFNKNRSNRLVLFIYAIIFPNFVMFAEAVQGYINGLFLTGILMTFVILFLKINLHFSTSSPNQILAK